MKDDGGHAVGQGEREREGARARTIRRREEAPMMGVKRSAKKRRSRRTEPFCLSRRIRSKVPLYPTERREASAVPWRGPHGEAAGTVAFIRHEIRKMRAIMVSQLSRTRLVIY